MLHKLIMLRVLTFHCSKPNLVFQIFTFQQLMNFIWALRFGQVGPNKKILLSFKVFDSVDDPVFKVLSHLNPKVFNLICKFTTVTLQCNKPWLPSIWLNYSCCCCCLELTPKNTASVYWHLFVCVCVDTHLFWALYHEVRLVLCGTSDRSYVGHRFFSTMRLAHFQPG